MLRTNPIQIFVSLSTTALFSNLLAGRNMVWYDTGSESFTVDLEARSANGFVSEKP